MTIIIIKSMIDRQYVPFSDEEDMTRYLVNSLDADPSYDAAAVGMPCGALTAWGGISGIGMIRNGFEQGTFPLEGGAARSWLASHRWC